MEPETRIETLRSLDHFGRIISPGKVANIKTQTVDEFIAQRRTEPGRKQGDAVSPATVNKDLRSLKAVLRIAHE